MSDEEMRAHAAAMVRVDKLWQSRLWDHDAKTRHLFLVLAGFDRPVRLETARKACQPALSVGAFRRITDVLKAPLKGGGPPLVESFRGTFGREWHICLTPQGAEFMKELAKASEVVQWKR